MPANMTPAVLITGGAKRIGKSLCQTLHHQGFDILLHYRSSSESAQALAADLNAQRQNSVTLLPADLDDSTEVTHLAQRVLANHQNLTVLINNASTFYPTPIGETTEAQWHALFGSNCKAPFFLSQALSGLLAENAGSIINITDIYAERPMPNHTVYCMAKSANRMLTQSLALELAPKVRVNGIAPGAILWPEDTQGTEVVNNDKLKQIPLAKLGGTDSICQTALLLINNSYLTGQIINVDGGRTLKQ